MDGIFFIPTLSKMEDYEQQTIHAIEKVAIHKIKFTKITYSCPNTESVTEWH